MASCPGAKRSGRDGQDRPADILLPVRTGSPVPRQLPPSSDDECGWNERQLVPFINTHVQKNTRVESSSNRLVFLPKEGRIIRIQIKMYLYSPFYTQCHRASHTPIELLLNQPKPSIFRISEHKDSYICLMNDPPHLDARPTEARTVCVC